MATRLPAGPGVLLWLALAACRVSPTPPEGTMVGWTPPLALLGERLAATEELEEDARLVCRVADPDPLAADPSCELSRNLVAMARERREAQRTLVGRPTECEQLWLELELRTRRALLEQYPPGDTGRDLGFEARVLAQYGALVEAAGAFQARGCSLDRALEAPLPPEPPALWLATQQPGCLPCLVHQDPGLARSFWAAVRGLGAPRLQADAVLMAAEQGYSAPVDLWTGLVDFLGAPRGGDQLVPHQLLDRPRLEALGQAWVPEAFAPHLVAALEPPLLLPAPGWPGKFLEVQLPSPLSAAP